MKKKHHRYSVMGGLFFLFFLICGHATGIASPSAESHVITRLSEQLTHAEGQDQIALLIRRGEACQNLGHIREAISDFRAALTHAKNAGHPLLTVVASQALGYGHFLNQALSPAETILREALRDAESLNPLRPALAASCANRLGTVLFRQNRREEVYLLYQKALEYAEKADDPSLTAGIHRNLAHIFSDDTRALSHLNAARNSLAKIVSPEERIDLLLGIAAEARFRKQGSVADFAREALTEALALASGLPDRLFADRKISLAAGRLGALHEQSGQMDDAFERTSQALTAAQRIRAYDLALLWEWQLGRLLRASNDPDRAIAAFRRAVYYIETIRQDIPITYQDGRSSFRETLSPIYLGLTDMLLEKSGRVPDETTRQKLLREAQQVVETIKQSELRDYFQDPCIAAMSQGIESLSASTAVFYPIILSDRLELLLNIGGRLERETVPVARYKLEMTVNRLCSRLRRGKIYERLAREVHDWLIQPIEGSLEKSGVDILVYVPDGIFRLLPISALPDDKGRFLAERFPVVTVPGLTLLDPAPLTRGNMVSLMAGLSEPGPVVSNLPHSFFNALLQANRSTTVSGLRGVSVVLPEDAAGGQPDESAKPPRETLEQVRKKLFLPGVGQEIQQLSEQLPGKVLLNNAFLLERFSTELATESFRVIHVASHGYFGGKPEENFIMTYDRCLDMNRFESLIRPRQLAAQPVDLITLSACQTAEGDDRSPLGLSGVVLKSGARSALGSLWPVADDAAQILLPVFYEHLKDPAVTKAEALRRAQVSLLKQRGFGHPFFWSPFILVGNWL